MQGLLIGISNALTGQLKTLGASIFSKSASIEENYYYYSDDDDGGGIGLENLK